jgi:hypothetical protein
MLQRRYPHGQGGLLVVFALVLSVPSAAQEVTAIATGNDAAGRLHVVAQEAGGRLWHLTERSGKDPWTSEWVSAPPLTRSLAVVGTAEGGVEILAIATGGELMGALQGPDGSWSEWRGMGANGIEDVVALRGADGTIAVVTRDREGRLAVGAQPQAGAMVGNWQPVLAGTVGRPLIAPGPKGLLVAARDRRGVWQSVEGAVGGGWSRPIRLRLPEPLMGAELQAITDERGAVLFIGKGPRGELWQAGGAAEARPLGFSPRNSWAAGRVGDGIAALVDERWIREVLTKVIGITLTIDSVVPDPQFEEDPLTVRYTVRNLSFQPAQGTTSGSLTGVSTPKMEAVGAPVGALANGEAKEGTFTLAQFQTLRVGNHFLRVSYDTGTDCLRIPWNNGAIREICITQTAAADGRMLTVKGYQQAFDTDDLPVTAGPVACCGISAEAALACGDGACDAADTPTATCDPACPADCPGASVRSYSFQTLCPNATRVASPPASAADASLLVKDAVAGNRRVRVVARQHSANPILCTKGDAISTERLMEPPLLGTFEGEETVLVGAGFRLHDLNKFLHENRKSLGFAVPGFRDPSVGGAVATGTHGSSTRHSAVVSSKVRWLEVVLPSGDAKEFSASTTDAETWKALRANLGYLGVVTRLRLAVEPAFRLKVSMRWTSADALLKPGAPYNLIAGCDWGQMVWFPRRGEADAPLLVLCGKKTEDPEQAGVENRLLNPEVLGDFFARYGLGQLQDEACGGGTGCFLEAMRSTLLQYAFPGFTGSDCPIGAVRLLLELPTDTVFGLITAAGAAAPFVPEAAAVWGAVSPILFTALPIAYITAASVPTCTADLTGAGYLMMSSELVKKDTRPFQRDWEIVVPDTQAQPTLQAAFDYFKTHQMCLPLIGVFIRFAPAEDTTLLAHTVAQGDFKAGQPAMFFEMPAFIPKGIKCSDLARHEKQYADLAEILVKSHGGRGHWGKNRRSLFQLQRKLGTYGDNLKRFRKVVQRMDPAGTFANQYGIDLGLRWPLATPLDDDEKRAETPACVPD